MDTPYKQVQFQLREYIRINTFRGLSLFIIDMSMYIACIAGVLYLPELWMKLIASLVAGLKMGNLATISHDAAHNSLTKSRLLNKFIGIVSYLPGLFNYRLWIYDHHVMHHSRTNENFPDSYTPFSKKEYDSLTPTRRWLERLYRKPSVLYFGLYYIVERWRKVKLYPRQDTPKEIRASAWRYFGLLMIYITTFIGALYFAPLYSNTSSLVAISLGFVLPFYIFQSLFAFTVYVQHTHTKVAWFKEKPDRLTYGRQDIISVDLVFPEWLSSLMHNVYTHAAHHVCPAIPCYELPNAEKYLNKLMEGKIVSQKFSFSWLFDTMEKCKLYDYENHCWVDFDGNLTTGSTLQLPGFDMDEAA